MNARRFSDDVWLFPGQGAQGAGMFDRLAGSRDLIDKIEDLVGPPAGALRQLGHITWTTQLVQPAVFAASVAATQAISTDGLPAAVIGHSMGEITALVASEAISVDDGLRLVVERGSAMEAAAGRVRGGMAAVIGLDDEVIREICGSIGSVWVANYNAPEQIVISGAESSLARTAERCLEAGARAVKRLAVPVAAHTPLMELAATRLRAVLDEIEVSAPKCSFFSVVDGRPHQDPKEIVEILIAGITSPVLFHQTVRAAVDSGLTNFVEVGPGGALGRIVGRSFPNTTVRSVATDDDAAQYRADLQVVRIDRTPQPAGADD